MRYVNVGRSGLKVSRIGLGCMSFGVEARAWRLDEAASRPVIAHALERGITFFDTADMYGGGESETVLGRAIADMARRDEVVIATKLFYPVRPDPNGRGLSRKAIFAAVDASLRRLRMDYIDIYQIHRWDDETPIEETMDALDDVVRSGKVRYLGASSMSSWQLLKAQHVAALAGGSRFISVQPHYNLINREEEREMLPMCRSEGIGVFPWSPLARGRLARPWLAQSSSDRVTHDRTAEMLYAKTEDADARVVASVGEVAGALGVTFAQVSLAWLLAQPAVTAPIVGAGKVAHLDDAIKATDLALDDDHCRTLEASYIPHAASFHRQEAVPSTQSAHAGIAPTRA
jgi:aryl-alcohol dehydrogenase-like predicted oxidoreductase